MLAIEPFGERRPDDDGHAGSHEHPADRVGDPVRAEVGAAYTHVRRKMMPSAVATTAAFALWPDGNDPKSGVTRMSSGRGRATITLMTRVTVALARAAAT